MYILKILILYFKFDLITWVCMCVLFLWFLGLFSDSTLTDGTSSIWNTKWLLESITGFQGYAVTLKAEL